MITRWTFRRKLRVVLQVKQGIITAERAYEHYGLSKDELDEWTRKYDESGPLSLRSTARPKAAATETVADSAPA